MKKSLLILGSIILLAGFSQAQDNDGIPTNRTDYRNRLLFGIKAGTNYSKVTDSQGNQFQADPNFGFAGGVFIAIPVGKYLGLQPELLYSQKGFKANGSFDGGTYELKRTSTYINIPVLFALKPSEFITVLAGPQYSHLLKQKDTFSNTASNIQDGIALQVEDQSTSTFGLLAGIDLTMKHLVLGGRIGWDMQKDSGDATPTPQYKGGWYQLTIGYRFYRI